MIPHPDVPRQRRDASDILAWLNGEQRQAARWMLRASGVYVFTLTGPELMRIRHALEDTGRLDAEAQKYLEDWCREENRAERLSALLTPPVRDDGQPEAHPDVQEAITKQKERHEDARMASPKPPTQHIDAGLNETDSASVSDTQGSNEV